MKDENLAGASKDQLNLVLGFFSRVDSKASVVLAVDTGMVGYLATHLPAPRTLAAWELIPPGLAFLLSALSYWHLYKGAFPTLEGGNLSLIYFREIAKRTESKFIDCTAARKWSVRVDLNHPKKKQRARESLLQL